MITVKIPVSVVAYVKSKKKYNDAYMNKMNIFTEGFRKSVFSIKSFLTDCDKKDELLYISVNYCKLIPKKFASAVFGKGFNFSFSDNKDKTEKVAKVHTDENIESKLIQIGRKQSYLGYGVIRVRGNKKDGIRVESVPVRNYFPNTEGLPIGNDIRDINEHNILTIYKEKINGTEKFIADLNHYRKEGNGWIGQYSKHIVSDKFGNSQIECNESNLVPGTEVFSEKLEYLPIFVFNNDENNDEDEYEEPKNTRIASSKVSGYTNDYLGDSDLVDALPIIQEINDKISLVSVELTKHGASKMSLPEEMADVINNDEKAKELPAYERFVHGSDGGAARYITKDMSGIDKLFTSIDRLIRQLAAVSDIPLSYFGIDENTRQLVGVTDKKFEGFYERCDGKRKVALPVLKRMYAYIGYLLDGKYEEPVIRMPELGNRDLKELSDVYTNLHSDKLISQKTAISKIFDLSDEEAQSEIDLISQEQNINNIINGTVPQNLNSNITL